MASVFKKVSKQKKKNDSLFEKELHPELSAEDLSSSSSDESSKEDKKMNLPSLKGD